MAFFKGFVIGLAMVIFVGPVFFTLLQSSLQSGSKSGIGVALGIFWSDVLVVVLCFFGASQLFQSEKYNFWIAVAGAIILTGMGLKYILKPNLKTEVKIKLKKRDFVGFFAKGFLVNFVNPFVFLVWIGLIAYAKNHYENLSEIVLFLSASLLAILCTDLLKVFLAQKIKPFLNQKILIWVYRVIGVLLIVFAFRMLIYVI